MLFFLGYNGIIWVFINKGIVIVDIDEERVLSCKWNNSIIKVYVEIDFIVFKFFILRK